MNLANDNVDKPQNKKDGKTIVNDDAPHHPNQEEIKSGEPGVHYYH
jgi:hypothetical protein